MLALSDAIAEVSRGQLECADDAAPVMFSATDRPLPACACGLIDGARQLGRSIGARTGRLDAAARRLGLAGYGHNDLSRPHGSPGSGGYRRTWRRRWRRAVPWSAISRLDDLCCFSSRLTLSSAPTRPVSRVKMSHFAAALGQSARFRRNFAVLDHWHIFLKNDSVGLYCN